MAAFYGTLAGKAPSRATREGSADSGIVTQAASWGGCIEVRTWRDKSNGHDMFEVNQIPWQGHGISEQIAAGVIGQPSLERFGVIKEADEWEAEKHV